MNAASEPFQAAAASAVLAVYGRLAGALGDAQSGL